MGILDSDLGSTIILLQGKRSFAVLSFRAFGTSCKVKYSPLDSIDYESVSQQVKMGAGFRTKILPLPSK